MQDKFNTPIDTTSSSPQPPYEIGTRWEYEFLHEKDYDKLIDILNALGSDGFEVIKILEYWERHIEGDASLYTNVWLKRPITLRVRKDG